MINENKNIVYTAGAFDIFHFGHVRFLRRGKIIANRINGKLIVGIYPDKLIKSYKKHKPIMPYRQRAEVVKSCIYVDSIVRPTELIGIKLIKKLKPKIIITISKWRNLEAIKWAKNNGIKIIYLPYTKGISSTLIKQKFI